MMTEMLFTTLAGGMGDFAAPAPAVKCPHGHKLKRRKAEADYMCDKCNRKVVEGRRLGDCRKCDYSLCQKCYKMMEEAAARAAFEEDSDDEEQELYEMVDAFCEENIRPVRRGSLLKFQCSICEAEFSSTDKAAEHAFSIHFTEAFPELGGSPDTDMFDLGDLESSAPSSGPRRSRKRR